MWRQRVNLTDVEGADNATKMNLTPIVDPYRQGQLTFAGNSMHTVVPAASVAVTR
jgi:hypothetical protein